MAKNEWINPIAGKEDKIINYFVDFYGEKYRNIITDRIKNTIFIWPQNDLAMERRLKVLNEMDSFNEKFAHRVGCDSEFKAADKDPFLLVEAFWSVPSAAWQIDDCRECFYNLARPLGLPASFVELELEAQKEYLLAHRKEIKSKLKIIEKVWHKEFKKDALKLGLKKAKIDQLKTGFEIQKEYSAKINNLLGDYLKNTFNFAQKHLIDNKIIQYYQDVLQSGKDAIKEDGWIYSQQNFIMFCKKLGINLGYNYSDYVNNEQLMNAIFNKNIINQLNTLKHNQEIDILKNSSLEHHIQQLNEANLKCGNGAIIGSLKRFLLSPGKTAAFCVYSRDVNNNVKRICVCPVHSHDSTIWHELGHIVQSSILYEQEKFCILKAGLAPYKIIDTNYLNINSVDEINKLPPYINHKTDAVLALYLDRNVEKYVNETDLKHEFDEVVNDYLAIKMYNKAQKDGFTIVGSEGTFQSTYSLMFPIMEEFIEKNLNNLKTLAIESNYDALQEYFGRTSFKELKDNLHDILQISDVVSHMGMLTNYKHAKNTTYKDMLYYNLSDFNSSQQHCLKSIVNVQNAMERAQAFRSLFDQDVKLV